MYQFWVFKATPDKLFRCEFSVAVNVKLAKDFAGSVCGGFLVAKVVDSNTMKIFPSDTVTG